MSALGQKQTCAAQNGMSALPPKADMCSALGDVRFVPKADIEPKTERSPWSVYAASPMADGREGATTAPCVPAMLAGARGRARRCLVVSL